MDFGIAATQRQSAPRC